MKRDTRALAAALWIVSAGCQRGEQPGGAGAASEALIVLEGARDVQRQGRGGASAVAYELDVDFPAGKPILEIVRRLEDQGWTPLKEDDLNPGIPTSMVRSWTSYIDTSGRERIQRYSWVSDWKNAADDRAKYSFSYEAPEGGEAALRHLQVSGSVYSAELNKRLQPEIARMRERNKRPADEYGGSVRTALEARVGWAFLASGPGGEAVFQVTGTPGDQVAYRWRFREPGGNETNGAAPAASTLQAGPFQLFWLPHSPFGATKDGAAVAYSGGMDLIPVPGDQFDSLDLAQVHALATLLPDRNQRFAQIRRSPAEDQGDRLMALMESGSTVLLRPDRALLVQGPQGRGVIEVVEPALRSVKYRWRFRGASSDSDTSGEAEVSESPFPNLRVGPYALQWQMRSMSEMTDEKGRRITDWSADVKYLAGELSVDTIPVGDAVGVDLSEPTNTRKTP